MDDFEKGELRGSESLLRQALEDLGTKFIGRNCKCPFHDDKHPSASIYFKNGVWKFMCHSCKVNEDVIGVRARANGIKSGDVMKAATTNGHTNGHHNNSASNGHTKPPAEVYPDLEALKASYRATDVFPYTDPKTRKADLVVLRRDESDGKKISQCHRVDGGFSYGAPPKPENGYPIFNRIMLEMHDTVFVVEGEKKAKILKGLGFAATTSPMGAGKAEQADWSPLNAKKVVVLWPDHDDPDKDGVRKGHAHMITVAELLSRLDEPPQVRWVDPEIFSIPPKGDVEQYLELHGGEDDVDRKRAIQTVIDIAYPLNGSQGLSQLLEDTISGKRSALPTPWAAMDAMSQMLLPGTVTCICGDPGCSKSFLILQAGLYWHQIGIKTAIYMLEEDREFHLNRSLAIIAGNSNLTDARWMKAHADEVRDAYHFHQKTLDSFARCLYTAPDKAATLPELASWVDEQARKKCSIIAIDPITMASAGDKRFLEDAEFMARVKTTVRRHACRVIITTHPKTGAKGPLDMAGGACYPRFSQNVLWVHAHLPPKKLDYMAYQGQAEYCKTSGEANRTIILGKTRNGRGNGSRIAYNFDKSTLRFVELGPVVKERKEKPDERD